MYNLGATLKFEVELISIKDAPPVENIFKKIDTDGNNELSQEEVNLNFDSISLNEFHYDWWNYVWLCN